MPDFGEPQIFFLSLTTPEGKPYTGRLTGWQVFDGRPSHHGHHTLYKTVDGRYLLYGKSSEAPRDITGNITSSRYGLDQWFERDEVVAIREILGLESVIDL